VVFHLENVRRKFNVTTMRQAIVGNCSPHLGEVLGG
jgi:hypothetical protein